MDPISGVCAGISVLFLAGLLALLVGLLFKNKIYQARMFLEAFVEFYRGRQTMVEQMIRVVKLLRQAKPCLEAHEAKKVVLAIIYEMVEKYDDLDRKRAIQLALEDADRKTARSPAKGEVGNGA